MTELSVVIPCFNEAENLHELIKKLSSALEGQQVEVILVDNGSNDESPNILADAAERHEFLRVLTVEKNQGYGHGILRGLEVAKGQLLAWTHADLQTEPSDILKSLAAFKRINDKQAIVKGKRSLKNRPLLDVVLTQGMQTLASLILNLRLSDINAQPKLFGREFYRQYLASDAPEDFSLDLYLLACAKQSGVRIETFPVTFLERRAGVAKGGGGSVSNRLKVIGRTLKYIMKLKSHLRAM